MMKIPPKFSVFFLFSILIANPVFAAILPHQGRVLVNGSAFDGIGYFRFALVSQSGQPRWSHDGTKTIPPGYDLAIGVREGFYQCKLGDVSLPGMEPLPDELFLYDDPLSLRIWFSDGNSSLEQLGPDQPLQIAPYAISTPWTNTDEIASLLSKELDSQANDTGSTSTSLIERLVSIASKSPKEDFDGLIPLSMLHENVTIRLDNAEENINAANLKNESQDNDILELESEVSSLRDEATLQGNQLESMSGDITANQTSLITLDIKVSDAQRDIGEIKALTTDITSNTNNISSLQSQNLDSRVTDSEASIETIESENSTQSDNIASNLGSIENLLAENSNQKDELDSLKTSISEVNSSTSAHLSILDKNITSLYDRNVTTAMLEDNSITHAKLSLTLLKYLQPFVLESPGPDPITLPAGQVLELNASFDGRFLTYQWMKNDSNITNATSTSYRVESAESSDSGVYTVTATNDFGSATSDSVTVEITSP
jgi:predicted  nucleic acid-binding Zn-ribbon protein